MKGRIEAAVNTLRDERLKELCEYVLSDSRFHDAPGSSGHHHAFKGGLYEHTAEVMQLAREMSTNDTMLELLTVASVFHDRNKIMEYTIEADGSISKLPYRKLIGHVVGSWGFFMECSRLDFETEQRIGHCLLAHHGRLEWRSPVEPQTLEAHILHIADMTSMQRGSK